LHSIVIKAERNGSEAGEDGHNSPLRFEALCATAGYLLRLSLDSSEPFVVGVFPP
jgi:hypothetical protein